ncbi:MAG: LPS-assembly protein LptD [Rubricella sp.]
MRRLALGWMISALLATAAAAQDGPIGLIADSIRYDREARTLTAEGSVIVTRGDTTLRTDLLIYNDALRTLSLPRAFVVEDGDGARLFASTGELDADFRNGLMRDARAIIDARLTLAADTVARVDGRYTTLARTIASTCEVCAEAPVPVWLIRAERVVHDSLEREVHYEDAVFELFGVPVLWFPYLRHPDPTVERATGFLTPSFSNSDRYGLGVKTPYHIVLDASRDLTITPFFTGTEGVLLETEYRQRIDGGGFDVTAIGQIDDSLNDEDGRWSLSFDGWRALPDNWRATLELELVSDDAFRREFGYDSRDRLRSRLAFAQVRENGFTTIEGVYYTSLRDGDPQSSIPVALPTFDSYEILSRDGPFGSTVSRYASGAVLTRDDGRDVARLTFGAGLQETVFAGPGLRLRGLADFAGDIYLTADDPAYPSEPVYRFRPVAGIEVGWPLGRHGPGIVERIEPLVQFIVAGDDSKSDEIPNEDSLQVELDETNLFSLSRFPGEDRFEPGLRLNAGLRYQRLMASGWRATAAFGQVLRTEPIDGLASGSGLGDTRSNIVANFSLDRDGVFRSDARISMDDSFDLSSSEFLFEYDDGRRALSGSYVYLEADGTPSLTEDRAEILLEAAYVLQDGWRLEGLLRRDIADDELIEAGLRLGWANDCADLAFSVTRDYTRTDDVAPATVFGLTFRFAGLGEDAPPRGATGRCRPG